VRDTPRITADVQLLMDDLIVEDTRGYVPEDGVTIGTDENSQPIRAEERIAAKLTTRLSVASGQARAAQVVTTSSKSGRAQTFVIVGARIVEP